MELSAENLRIMIISLFWLVVESVFDTGHLTEKLHDEFRGNLKEDY